MSDLPSERGSLYGRYVQAKQILGIDRAVGFTMLNRAWSFVSFPLTMYLLTTFFTKEVQGLYYTFASLLFLQSILELGFGTVMLQFVSHEWAKLGFDANGRIEGDDIAAGRLASLLRMSLFWYAGMALIFFLGVGTFGHFFLGQHAGEIDYRLPWWLLCATISLSFLLVPFRGVLEGSNQVARCQRITLLATICSSLASWLSIYFGAGLYTLAATNGMLLLIGCLLVLPACRPFFGLMKRPHVVVDFSWRREFWPQQWRIGTSWLCGFFMFQSFVPFIYQFHGAAAAGRMGATLQIYNAVNTFAQSWTYAVAPKMGMLAANHDYKGLRMLVRGTYRRSLAASIFFSIAALAVIGLMHLVQLPQAQRFADPLSIIIFLLTLIGMQLPNVETQAVRFQKKEPYLKISISSAALVLLSNAVLGSQFEIRGIVSGFGLVMICFLIPLCHRIYREEMGPKLAVYPLGG